MTKADGTPPSAEETANYTERLLAALTRLLGDDDSARASMETTLERARAGNALRGVSEEALDEYLRRVCARVEKHIDELTLTTTRRGTSLSNKKSKVADVIESTVQECYREFSEEPLAEYHANVQMMEDQRRELKAAKEQSEAAARVASSSPQCRCP